MMPSLADILLAVVDDEILVSLPGTIDSVIYYKPANSKLLPKNLPHKDDGRTELKQAEFLAKAWRLRTTKLVIWAGSSRKSTRPNLITGLVAEMAVAGKTGNSPGTVLLPLNRAQRHFLYWPLYSRGAQNTNFVDGRNAITFLSNLSHSYSKGTAMSEMQQGGWTKPAAMAIPKGGFFKDKVEQGRYGAIFPKSPACYGFSILAKIIPGREEVFYEYARNIEKVVADQPDCLAVLKLHYLR